MMINHKHLHIVHFFFCNSFSSLMTSQCSVQSLDKFVSVAKLKLSFYKIVFENEINLYRFSSTVILCNPFINYLEHIEREWSLH